MIEIKRWTDGAVLYTAKTAQDVRTALEEAVANYANLHSANLHYANLHYANLHYADLHYANLHYADLHSANLRSANLRSANLRSANLRSADLHSADLHSANLRYADLRSANLHSADLRSADLRSADLHSANLHSAEGLRAEWCNDLLILADQVGKVRAYKLVKENGQGPFNGGITYEKGENYEVKEVDTDPANDCGAGINLATLPWCIANWRSGYRILVAEFKSSDIAAIPVGDGKFRVRACKIVGEKDTGELGLGEPVPEEAEVASD